MKRLNLLASLIASSASLIGLVHMARAVEPPVAAAALVESKRTETAAETKFIRVRRDDKERPAAMETAVVHYTSPSRPDVAIDLVGAVHVGDRSYYDNLN